MRARRDPSPAVSRRQLLLGAAGAGLAAALGPRARGAPPARDADRIRSENERPGTRDWLLSRTRVDPATRYRCPWIEGYVSRTSLRAGESLDFMVSTNPASAFLVDVYRLGYYGGQGGRHLARLGPFRGAVQPEPPVGALRLRECRWEPAARLTVPADWTSGVYLGKLTAERGGWQSYVVFVVRDDRPCDFLFQCSTATWAAYNRWPDQWSLYDDGSKVWYAGPGVRVSFDRPYGKYCHVLNAPLSQGSGEFLLWEFPLAFWMEQQGYDVSYVASVDTHRDAAGLLRTRAWLSVGHDEYWSLAMLRHVRAAVEAGVHVGFFSGNTCYGVIPFLPSSTGAPDRVISRVDQFGPIDERDVREFPEKGLFDHSAPDPVALLGARTVHPAVGVADWTCAKQDHWIFADTGMRDGDAISGLVGWEWHGAPAKRPGLEVVARGPVRSSAGEGEYTATVYPGPRENVVFNAATIWWGDGLAEPPGYRRPRRYERPTRLKGPDPRVQRITRNVLERFRG